MLCCWKSNCGPGGQ